MVVRDGGFAGTIWYPVALIVLGVVVAFALSAGRIDVREYTSQRPQFSGYVLLAIGLWLTAVLLKFGFPQFRTFP